MKKSRMVYKLEPFKDLIFATNQPPRSKLTSEIKGYNLKKLSNLVKNNDEKV